MPPHIDITIEGDVADRQELLNATQIVTIDGASPDGAWQLSALITWSMRDANATEGDVTLTCGDDEIFATLTGGRVTERAETEGGHAFSLEYETDGGAGAYADARGVITARGVIEESTFSGTWRVKISAL
jgi:hypothetical protein